MPAVKQSVSFERAAGAGPASKGGTSWIFEEKSEFKFYDFYSSQTLCKLCSYTSTQIFSF